MEISALKLLSPGGIVRFYDCLFLYKKWLWVPIISEVMLIVLSLFYSFLRAPGLVILFSLAILFAYHLVFGIMGIARPGYYRTHARDFASSAHSLSKAVKIHDAQVNALENFVKARKSFASSDQSDSRYNTLIERKFSELSQRKVRLQSLIKDFEALHEIPLDTFDRASEIFSSGADTAPADLIEEFKDAMRGISASVEVEVSLARKEVSSAVVLPEIGR